MLTVIDITIVIIILSILLSYKIPKKRHIQVQQAEFETILLRQWKE
jgi:competence protein ComGC